MHVRDLVDFAAILATRSDAFIVAAEHPQQGCLEQYWAASKCRHERWARSMKAYDTPSASPAQQKLAWSQVRPVLEEILLSEMLTRVWTAAATLHDQLRGANDLEPIARSVLIGHMEARHRALNLMVYGKGFDVAEAVSLNRLRRRAERWTDLLLARFTPHRETRDLPFDRERTMAFRLDMNDEPSPGGSWNLLLASLRVAFRQGVTLTSPNPDLNEQIAGSLLSCLGPELFDGTGVLKSMWMVRVTQVANDTQGMIDELIAIDRPRRPSANRLNRRVL